MSRRLVLSLRRPATDPGCVDCRAACDGVPRSRIPGGRIWRQGLVLALLAVPAPAVAHDAFGDLGPFYQGLLHPLADPAQGLLLVAAAVLLARQPLAAVRPAYAALAAAGLMTLAVGTLISLPAPGLRTQALVALAVALAALVPFRPGPVAIAAVAAVLGGFAALPLDAGNGVRAVVLGLLGGASGIALATLLFWGAANWADRRISPFASAVAASWVGAIGLMVAVLPA